MIRGTFANIRLRNQLAPGTEGGVTANCGRRAALDLRRGPGLRGRGDAAGRARRQGVRLRLLARLGGQGHRAAGCPGRHRRVLRAHPPLEPHRHGRAAAAVRRGADARVARPDRRGDFTIAGSPARATVRDAHGAGRRQELHGSCGSTPRASRRTTATAGSLPTSCARCSSGDRHKVTPAAVTLAARGSWRSSALRIAREAGELLAAGRKDVEVAATKSSPTDVVTAMDRASEAAHRRLLDELAPATGCWRRRVRHARRRPASSGSSTPRRHRELSYGVPFWAVSVAARMTWGPPVVHWPASCTRRSRDHLDWRPRSAGRDA